MPRVLVCGGRDFRNKAWLFQVLDGFHKAHGVDLIIHGNARGADKFSGLWAYSNKVECRLFNANWERYGYRAGFLRNRRMLEEGEPEVVIAFPGGKGTGMMVRIAKEAGVPMVLEMQKPPVGLADA